jgi:hypothetical protein
LRVFWQPAAAIERDPGSGQPALRQRGGAGRFLASIESGLRVSFYMPLLVLAVVYVPGVLLLSGMLGRLGGGLGSVFRRDYSPLLT